MIRRTIDPIMAELWSGPDPILRFGTFEVDRRSGELHRAGVRVPVQDQPFRILIRLLDHPGQVVTRDELRRKLWPDAQFGDFEHGLNAAVKRLRDALDDSADNPRFIETLPRRGYRFIAPVFSPSPVANHPTPVEAPEAATPAPSRSPRYRVRAVEVALAVVVLVGIAWAGQRWIRGGIEGRRLQPAAPIQTVVVMPFANLTGDPAQDYVVDGIAESFATELSRASTLEIVSATTASQYKTHMKTTREIGRELGVDGLVEGSVSRNGGNLHITVDLVDARRDTRIWTDAIDEPAGDLRSVSPILARKVTAQLKSSIGDPHIVVRPINPEAYDAYIKGVYFANRWQVRGCVDAIPLLEKAVALDPDYADTYTKLAFCYVFPARSGRPGWESGPKARAAAASALKLDSRSAAAHAMSAWVRLLYDFDWPGAEAEMRTAVSLDPRDPTAQMSLGTVLYATGRDEEGLPHVREAVRLEPLSNDRLTAYAFALSNTGRFDEAITQLKIVLDRDPHWTTARRILAQTYGDAGHRDEAVAEQILFVEQTARHGHAYARDLRATYARQGWDAFWRQELQFANAERKDKWTDTTSFARRYARLGERQHALEELERAYTYHDHLILLMDCDRAFDQFRGDSRYEDLRRRVGLAR